MFKVRGNARMRFSVGILLISLIGCTLNEQNASSAAVVSPNPDAVATPYHRQARQGRMDLNVLYDSIDGDDSDEYWDLTKQAVDQKKSLKKLKIGKYWLNMQADERDLILKQRSNIDSDNDVYCNAIRKLVRPPGVLRRIRNRIRK